jgi:hypothetical protein
MTPTRFVTVVNLKKKERERDERKRMIAPV